ncbi:MAG: hypothetical protein IJZ59_06020 [Alphaproteobacteria bacterium]|nr:hypothetical protein [Alphaproteobacteria bacterium]
MAKNNENKKNKWGQFFLTVATFCSTLIPLNSSAQKTVEKDSTDGIRKVWFNKPTRDIDYQVDTLPNPRSLATYSTLNNSITLHYDNTMGKDYTIPEDDIATIVIHEQKHRDNKKNGLYSRPVNPDQSYKLDMHDEISANMAELIYLRDKYIKTGDISVFDVSYRFDFYKEAIKKGEINPNSPYREDFDKDMALIVNGTTEMWEENFKSRYSTQNSTNAIASDLSGRYAKWHDENYQESLKIAYTIGGVDFTQYKTKDIELDDFGKKQLNYMLVQSYMYLRSQPNESIAQRFEIPKYDGKLTLTQYANLVQHALVLREMFIYDSSTSVGMSDMAKAYLSGEKTIEQLKEKYANSFEKKKTNHETMRAIMNGITNEYSKKGKKLPKKCKDEYYQQAVNDLYTVQVEINGETKTVNLREILNPDNNVPIMELPAPKNSYFVKAEKNETYPIQLSEPTYQKWEDKDGSRYSAVQHCRVLDTSKDVINKPQSSRSDETSSSKESVKYVAINIQNHR